MLLRKLLGSFLAFALVFVVTAPDVFAQGQAAFVNISGTSLSGNRVITIELRTATNQAIGNTSYTTQVGDPEENIADQLVVNFTIPGYKAKRMKDKPGGEEVVYIKRETGGMPFNVVITEDDPDVDVNLKGTYSRLGDPGRSMDVFPECIDFGNGTAQIQLQGNGTTWLTDVDGVEVRDLVNVTNFTIVNDELIIVDIQYGSNITSDPIHVDVFGQAQDDIGSTENNITLDVSTQPLVIRPVTRAPSLSLWSMLAVAAVAVVGAIGLLRRRSSVG